MNWVRNKISAHRNIGHISAKNYMFYVPMWFKEFIGIVFISTALAYASKDPAGNEYLKNGEYDKAIESYEALIKSGMIGHELFFNLGTAYSKQGNIPMAILNFEKALRMKPGDQATKQQLIQINLKLQDKPVIYDDSGLLAFFNKVQFSMGIDAWAFLSIFLMMLVPTAIFISYKFKTLKSRKLIFMSSLVWFVLSGFSVVMARNNYHYKYLHAEGIVIYESIQVYDRPEKSGAILFNLHEGTKVEIIDSTVHSNTTLYQIDFAGKKGWIPSFDIRKIEL